MSRTLQSRLLLLALCAAPAAGGHGDSSLAGYTGEVGTVSLDSIRNKALERATRRGRSSLGLGASIPGYLSPRGLPPIRGRLMVTDSGLVFHSAAGPIGRFPLVGPVREHDGRRWRPSSISLADVVENQERLIYVFRIDAGVFETDMPGPLLDLAAHPVWLDSLAASDWAADHRLVDGTDPAAVWGETRRIAASPYADSLYSLLGRPRAGVGLVGRRGRAAGRLGEYIPSRDSLALDPSGMSGEPQLRHAFAHELGHRWQARSKTQLGQLWGGVRPIRDPKRYGYGDRSEHQAEAIAFAINFLQATASAGESAAVSLALLDHYELLVPGTRVMVGYFARQPIYRNHPLQSLLRGPPSE